MRPVAVQIDYADWLAIEKQLGVVGELPESDLTRFSGTVRLQEDPLEYQRRVRRESSARH